MNYSVPPGAVIVSLLQDGPQSVELSDMAGKRIAHQSVKAGGVLVLETPGAHGMHLLVWRKGTARAAAKVVLD